MKYQMDTYIFEGLPVTVEFTMARAEPDVGIMSDYVDDWNFIRVNGKKVSDAFISELNVIFDDSKAIDRLNEEMAEYAGDYDQE